MEKPLTGLARGDPVPPGSLSCRKGSVA